MEEAKEVRKKKRVYKKSRKTSVKGKKRGSPRGERRRKNFTSKMRIKAVKLNLEENIPIDLICKKYDLHKTTFYRWRSLYKKFGETALEPSEGKLKKRQSKNDSIKQKAIEIKKQNPGFGVKRISQTLRRLFFLKVSPEVVRKTLKQENLIEKPKKKPKKNPARPRFFAKSTPNQMWQTDIFTFRLGGRYAYIIGFIDDYSRFITNMDLFRSQTTDIKKSLHKIPVVFNHCQIPR